MKDNTCRLLAFPKNKRKKEFVGLMACRENMFVFSFNEWLIKETFLQMRYVKNYLEGISNTHSKNFSNYNVNEKFAVKCFVLDMHFCSQRW